MGNVEAIKKYFGDSRPVENKEILELRRSMTESLGAKEGAEAFSAFAAACCKAMGVEHTPAN